MVENGRSSTVTLEWPTRAATPAFFAERPPGEIGLAVFLNAGDPPLDVLRDVVQMLDHRGVNCLELAVPFPNSVTDGPVIRRSARRALDLGVELDDVLAFVHDVHSKLKHLRIALLADWSYSVKPTPLPDFLTRVRDSGAHGLLIHALPPKLRQSYHVVAERAGMPIVTTCYASSASEVQAEAAHHASAYLYLVAHYGRTGAAPALDYRGLSGAILALRAVTEAPIAVGFGVSARAHIDALRHAGADAAIVGSAGVSRVECALAEGRDVVEELHAFVDDLRLPHRRVTAGTSKEKPWVGSFHLCQRGVHR
ncbi:MAG: tryptophan synthase subunit alpha [Actinomycetota bacterium]